MEKAALDLEIHELQEWAFKRISWTSIASLSLETLEGLTLRLSFPPLSVTSPNASYCIQQKRIVTICYY